MRGRERAKKPNLTTGTTKEKITELGGVHFKEMLFGGARTSHAGDGLSFK